MKTILTLAILHLLAVATAQAGPVLTLIPTDGAISGAPGQTVGWGFDLTADDTNWTSILSAFVLTDTNSALGVFTDLIGPQGGPSGGALAPGAPNWNQPFDINTFTGFGSYAIDPAALVGDSDSGIFLVEYELFNDNPATCGDCFVSSGEFFQDFTVNVVNAAPEPSSWLISLTGAALLALTIRIRKGREARRA